MELSGREEFILKQLMVQGYASTEALADLCGVSTASIRSDLRHLEAVRLIIRTPGGAKYLSETSSGVYTPFSMRTLESKSEKIIIAKQTFNLIREGMTLFLDSSTTIVELAKLLASSSKRVSVITHCFVINDILQNNPGVKRYFCGGRVWEDEGCCVGDMVVQSYGNYFADAALLSPKALHITMGCLNADEETTLIKQQMMQRVDHTWLLADHRKFDKAAAFQMCLFDKITRLITDVPVPPVWARALSESGTELLSPIL